ncbi:MAG: hypothetical protein CMH62_02195 [Nanoarchaeota archaeon]|nr:hypothetical protein [Nanoarchaeota archaeon]|tara:strand:- start:258 stop:896 length:639 start_codon:yes stop_codon:yes gene_type:complete
MVDIGSIIKGMKEKGADNSKIIDELKNKGHSSKDIYDSFSKGTEPTGGDLEAPSPEGEMQTSSISSKPMEEAAQPHQESPQQTQPDPAFAMPETPPQNIPQRQNIEQIEEIAEAIVEEKIQEFSSSIGDINIWKERSNAEIGAIKQEVIRLRNQLENLQIAILGKVENYNKSVITMSSEMKALSKVMEKIMQPLTMNVKELSRITEKFKKTK